MLSSHFLNQGWEVTILSVDPSEVDAPVDNALVETLPIDLRIIRVPALSRKWCRKIGIGNTGWRALPYLWQEGKRLLKQECFDLIYFSTTQFACLPLGRLWRRKFQIPYIIDLQDPWVNPYYERPDAPRPPGGWKYGIARRLAQVLEKWTVARSAHVIAVSPAYLTNLAERYAWFSAQGMGSVIPFGWSAGDVSWAKALSERDAAVPGDADSILYFGRLGEDMHPLISWFLSEFAIWRKQRAQPPQLDCRFIGTSYDSSSGILGTAAKLANQLSLQDVVTEQRERVPTSVSFRRQYQARANLILGSTDLAYTPSKIGFLNALERPWLAIVDARSEAAKRLLSLPGAAASCFAYNLPGEAERLHRWFEECEESTLLAPSTERTHFDVENESMSLSQQHVEIFESILKNHQRAD